MARGTWQGSGTFTTGDDGVQRMAYCLVAGVLVMAGVSWVLRHILWVVIPAGVLLVVAAAGLVWWRRGELKRKARYAALYAAAFEARRKPATVTATVIPQASTGTGPAIEQHVHHEQHYHLGNLSSADLAALLHRSPAERASLEGRE